MVCRWLLLGIRLDSNAGQPDLVFPAWSTSDTVHIRSLLFWDL
jgi:hypothetical protein